MSGSGRFPLVALVVLDGWGCAPPGPGNAVELAETPVFDRLWRTCPHTRLEASGGGELVLTVVRGIEEREVTVALEAEAAA